MKTFSLFICLCLTMMLHAQVSKTITISSGELSSALTEDEKNTITNLTVTGTIDARDFKTMRDDMSALKELDLSEVSILEYTGLDGTYPKNNVTTYPENSIPKYAFEDDDNIQSVIIPSSVVSIGYASFSDCDFLESFSIPSSSRLTEICSFAFEYCGFETIFIPNTVTYIGQEAFCRCTSLNSVTIPSSVQTISSCAFAHCSGLITVDENNPNYSSSEGVLYNKTKSTLIQCPISITGNFSIPLSVDSIGIDAFDYCIGLTSVIIPSSVIYIGLEAFYKCTGLNSIYNYSVLPVTLDSDRIFYDVDKQTCTLYVPEGSKSAYQEADQWKDFKNIVEMSGLTTLSSNTVNLTAFSNSKKSISINTTTTWIASSDQTWLAVSPASGTGDATITFTAEKNTSSSIRTATVTITATDVNDQIITVTQETETATLSVSTNTISLEKQKGSTATVDISSNISWTANSDQTWLSINSSSGTGNATITFTAEANTNSTTRIATVTVSATDVNDQIITVTQESGTTAVKTFSGESIKIYPNPISDGFYVKGINGNSTLELRDLIGKVQFIKQIDSDGYIPLNSIPKGVYLLKISSMNRVIEKKLIKE